MRILPPALAVIAMTMAGAAAAGGPGSISIPSSPPRYASLDQIGHSISLERRTLRAAALRQQAEDGGTLTPEHEAVYSRRLTRLQDRLRHEIVNNSRISVDANGHSVITPPIMARWTLADLLRSDPLS